MYQIQAPFKICTSQVFCVCSSGIYLNVIWKNMALNTLKSSQPVFYYWTWWLSIISKKTLPTLRSPRLYTRYTWGSWLWGHALSTLCMWCELWILVGLFCRCICYFFFKTVLFLLDLVPVRHLCGCFWTRDTLICMSQTSVSLILSPSWNSVVSGL